MLIWIGLAPISLFGFVVYAYQQTQQADEVEAYQSDLDTEDSGFELEVDQQYSTVKGITTDVQLGDARPLLIAEFLEKYDSPLKPYDYWGEFLTELADKHDMDYRLLPSIAMQESNLCKKIPPNSYNCLGLGVHSQGTWHFDRYEDNFSAAAEILRENYIDQGYITPEQIQTKYTPGSNGSWEYAVNYFMNILEYAEFE